MNFSENKAVQTVISALFCLALGIYGYLFWDSVSHLWFHPAWATDDALQQVYPFHKVLIPGLFKDDLITQVMEGYLPPLHYYISYLLTIITGDPIMMAHYEMLLQILILFVFIFAIVYRQAGFNAACLACLWLLHTRPFMQRMTGGLPRAWAAPVLAAFLYYLLKNDHKKILICLFLGCLLHPPSTMIAAAAYGLYLGYQALIDRSFVKPLLILIVLSPIYIFTTYSVVKRPPEIGDMVTLAEAEKLPEFQRPNGRFPFVPLEKISEELDQFAIQPFKSRLYSPANSYVKTIREFMIYFVAGIFLIVLFLYREFVPRQLVFYFTAIVLVYEASRLLAFRLYVPDRHLQMPLSIFWVTFFLITLGKSIRSRKYVTLSTTLIVSMMALSIFGSGAGLQGDLNFNYSQDKHGGVFLFARKSLPENVLIAGHPTHIDGLQLFGKRKAYATTETAHPFYQNYYKEIVRRLKISFQAHYALDPMSFIELMEQEKIDYFIFSRRAFYPTALSSTDYDEPLKEFVRNLAGHKPEEYLYKQIVSIPNFQKLDFIAFTDRESLVIDLKKFKLWAAKK